MELRASQGPGRETGLARAPLAHHFHAWYVWEGAQGLSVGAVLAAFELQCQGSWGFVEQAARPQQASPVRLQLDA